MLWQSGYTTNVFLERTEAIKAPFPLLGMISNPQLFLSGFKHFFIHRQGIQIEFARPHASDGIRTHSSTQGSSAIKCVQSVRHKARDRGAKYALLFLLCRHIGSPVHTVNGFVADSFVFHSGGRI